MTSIFISLLLDIQPIKTNHIHHDYHILSKVSLFCKNMGLFNIPFYICIYYYYHTFNTVLLFKTLNLLLP